jgi:hypothetical protein
MCGRLSSCRGPYLAIVNDYTWLAEEFIHEVIAFYEDVREDLPPLSERRLALLSFPIIQYQVPQDYLERDKLFNHSLLSVFRHELATAPRDLGWKESDPLGPLDTNQKTFKPHWFWDGQVNSNPNPTPLLSPISIFKNIHLFFWTGTGGDARRHRGGERL